MGGDTVYFQRGESHTDSEHFIQFAYLLYVFILDAEEIEFEVGMDSKEFPMGGGNLERKPHLVKWALVWLRLEKKGLGS